MKIKKLNEELLREADEEVIDVNQSVGDLASDIEDAYAEGGIVVPEANAESTAKEIKQAAAGIKEPVYTPIVVPNKLTKACDMALKIAKRNARKRSYDNPNILVDGLPGSGKTAIVRDWAKARGCNLVYVNAKNKDLDAFLNGYPVTMDDSTRRSGKKVDQAYSAAIDSLKKPNSILFLDEFNRASYELRAVLLTLINEHNVAGEDDSGYTHFDNMLFTIACINPATPTDPGADQLNDAELSRFDPHLTFEFDSDPDDTLAFAPEYFKREQSKLDPADPYFEEDWIYIQKTANLVIFMLNDPSFKYDDRSVKNLQSIQRENALMFNQRSFMKFMDSFGGEGVNAIIDMLELRRQPGDKRNSYSFTEAKRQMLLKILEKYREVEPKLPPEIKKKMEAAQKGEDYEEDDTPTPPTGKGQGGGDSEDVVDPSKGKQQVYDDTYSADFDSYDGDFVETDDFFKNVTGGKIPAVSPAEATKRITDFDWN
jgi:hypothetical protein